MTRRPGFEPGLAWWETSALTTAPSLLPSPSPFIFLQGVVCWGNQNCTCWNYFVCQLLTSKGITNEKFKLKVTLQAKNFCAACCFTVPHDVYGIFEPCNSLLRELVFYTLMRNTFLATLLAWTTITRTRWAIILTLYPSVAVTDQRGL